MPPPKKPKMGRTSLEQFLTEDERPVDPSGRRNSRDSEGNSPAGTIDDGSDGEVFNSASDSEKEINVKSSSNDDRATLFHKLLLKSRSVEEQNVLGSPDDDKPSPTASPPMEGENVGAFRKYQDHLRLQLERPRQIEIKLECTSPKEPTVAREPGSVVDYSSALVKERSSAPQQNMTTDQGRLIDTLVASALASSAAQSIIYGGRSTSYTAPAPNGYAHGQNVSFSTCSMKNFENEPHDLSKKPDAQKYLGHRLYEGLNPGDQSRLASVYREWTLRQNKDNALERSKQYLESHRRIVGLLSERTDESVRDERVADKENMVQAVPARYPNGIYSTVGINRMMGGYRYDTHQREVMDHSSGGKLEEGGCIMSPAGNYMPVHSMIPPGQPTMNQTPTSTNMEGIDRYHPALMNPHFLNESRRMKPESTHHGGGGVNKLCQVCNDNASGFHYGVWSCEGCKAFFKRSIQGPVDYVCPATNTCTIDKHRRKSCQACRLRKCYEVGMNKGSQRKERKSALQNKSPKRPRSDSGDTANGTPDSTPTPAKNSRKSRTTLIIQALSKADMPRLESYHNHSLPPTRQHLLASFVKLAEKELVYLINWAKNVPGYCELSLGDQVHLIECCWMELLFLNIVQRSLEHGGRRLVIAPDLVLERPYWATMGMSEVFEQLAAVSEQLVQYHLHNEEFLLLQATVLANAEVRKLASYSKLFEIKQSILDGVVDIAQKYHPDNLRHVPSLLLMLTHIRQAAERAVTYFQSLKADGTVTFCDLLSEMLDAQKEENAGCIS